MYFKKIHLKDWRQYGDVEFEFHRRLTVFTGANGTGKSVALNVLAAHYDYTPPLVSSLSEQLNYIAGVHLRAGHDMHPLFLHSQKKEIAEDKFVIPMAAPIAEVTYSDSEKGTLFVPFNVHSTFKLGGKDAKALNGLHFPAFEHPRRYHQVLAEELIFHEDKKDLPIPLQMLRMIRKATGEDGQQDCSKEIKLTLLNWLKLAEERKEFKSGFNDFEIILKRILPNELEFKTISKKDLELEIQTNHYKFALDASSGGIGKVLSISWQLFLFAMLVDQGVITMDEPENHLHPSMQQSLIAGLVDSFPNLQFIVATHSPFMVTSVKEAHVYAFQVSGIDLEVTRLDSVASQGLTPDEVLKTVLGLPFTLPLWIESEVNEVVEMFEEEGLDEKNVDALIEAIKSKGLEHVMPYALRSLARRAKSIDKD